MKHQRHKAILDLVRGGEIASQEDLILGLKARQIEVSQSTLSRDIQELGLAKAGGVYAVVEGEGLAPDRPLEVVADRPALRPGDKAQVRGSGSQAHERLPSSIYIWTNHTLSPSVDNRAHHDNLRV